MPLARPERTRFTLDGDVGATPIELPSRGTGAATLVVAAMFAVSLGVLVFVIRGMNWHAVRDVGDLVGVLFQLFWAIGWSIGVLLLGALTVLLSISGFYRESVTIAGGRLVSGPRLGPLRMAAEYDLARIRNLRVEPAGDAARVSFDYGEGSRTLGDAIPRTQAERIVAAIRAAMPTDSSMATDGSIPVAPAAATPKVGVETEPSKPLSPAAALALIGANLVPLAGVLFGGWRLDQVMVLFWAESAVVAFYTIAKMAIVARWLAIPAGLFFLAHFGAFMAIHFLFIYEMFVRGVHAHGPAPAVGEALAGIFAPLWPALLALFLSHGVSFAANFLGRTEHRGMGLKDLMAAPYQRVVLMQVTLIFGGFVTLALHDPRPALALLVGLKIAADFYSHRRERAGTEKQGRTPISAGTLP